MKTEHTPGPWSYYAGEAQPNPYWRNYRLYVGERLVAEIGCTNAVGDGDANARLIAAAPELLAALTALVGHADLGEVDLEPEEQAALASARAAIEKATKGT